MADKARRDVLSLLATLVFRGRKLLQVTTESAGQPARHVFVIVSGRTKTAITLSASSIETALEEGLIQNVLEEISGDTTHRTLEITDAGRDSYRASRRKT